MLSTLEVIVGRVEPVTRLRGVVLGGLMLVFGLLYGVESLPLLLQWSAVSAALALCAVLFLVCGIVMLACGLWCLMNLASDPRPFRVGGSATVICGMVVVIGVLAKAIPCSGPT